MPQDKFRIFLSAVTSEFGRARDALAADLRSREALVQVQNDFRQEAGRDTTLKKLYEYIRDCSAVVCVIGRRCGDVPPPAAAAPFAHILPPGTAKASYAQWEFFFARHHRRRLSIYMANHDYRPDTLAHTRERNLDLQQDFLKHIDEQGLDRNYFSNVDQLCRSVLKEDWPKKRALLASNVPIGVPIHFLGREDALTEIESALNGAERCVVMALHGLRGVGKTTVVAQGQPGNLQARRSVVAQAAGCRPRRRKSIADPLA
jgi:hypothetical protein